MPQRTATLLMLSTFLLAAIAAPAQAGLREGDSAGPSQATSPTVVTPDGRVLRTPDSEATKLALATQFPAQIRHLPSFNVGVDAASNAKLAALDGELVEPATTGPLASALLQKDDIKGCSQSAASGNCSETVQTCDPTDPDYINVNGFEPDQQWNTPGIRQELDRPPRTTLCHRELESCDPTDPFVVEWDDSWVPHTEGGRPMVVPQQCEPLCEAVSPAFISDVDPCDPPCTPAATCVPDPCDLGVGVSGVPANVQRVLEMLAPFTDPCNPPCQPAASCVPDPCDGSVTINTGVDSNVDPCDPPCQPAASCVPDPCGGDITINGGVGSNVDPCNCTPATSCLPDCAPASQCVPDPCEGTGESGGRDPVVDPCNPPCQPAASCVPDPCGGDITLNTGVDSNVDPCDPPCKPAASCVPDPCEEVRCTVPNPCERIDCTVDDPCETVDCNVPCKDNPTRCDALCRKGIPETLCTRPRPMSYVAPGYTRVEGRLMVPDQDSANWYPCAFCQIVVYDYDTWSANDYLGVGSSDGDGNFGITVDNDDAYRGQDPYLIVLTESNMVFVHDPASNTPYSVETDELYDDCPDAAVCGLGDVNLEDLTGDTNARAAFYIHHMALLTQAVELDETGEYVEELHAYFPMEAVSAFSGESQVDLKYNARYVPCDLVLDTTKCVAANSLYIGSGYAFKGETHAHEIGHGFFHLAMMNAGGTDADYNAAVACTGDHFFDGRSDAHCAFSEGFADFHGVFVVSGTVGPLADYVIPVFQPGWSGCGTPTAGSDPACYSEETPIYNIETIACVEPTPATVPATCPRIRPGSTLAYNDMTNMGYRVEGRVEATLWDLIDPVADTAAPATDAFPAHPLADIWTVLNTHDATFAHGGGPTTVPEFATAWATAGFTASHLADARGQSHTDVA